MSLKELARESLRIMEGGLYVAPSGGSVDLRDAVARAVEGTVLYAPEDFSGLRAAGQHASAGAPRIEVTAEKTGAAARRLVEEEGLTRVAALNFASAKNPGGGFLGGARAQEEDLARCSALYVCLLSRPDYYAANRAAPSALYTDHVIYSPDVPFFRDESLALLERPFSVSLVTAPAPNAGVARREGGDSMDRLDGVLRARARKVLQVLAHHGHTTLVLGAWGCGVFRNAPTDVARAFARALESLPGAFERVVFAVYERGGDGPNLRAFRDFFG